MKKSFLTKETVREVDVLKEFKQLLNHTLETEGPYLWAQLFQEKTANGTPSTEIAVSFDEVKAADALRQTRNNEERAIEMLLQ